MGNVFGEKIVLDLSFGNGVVSATTKDFLKSDKMMKLHFTISYTTGAILFSALLDFIMISSNQPIEEIQCGWFKIHNI